MQKWTKILNRMQSSIIIVSAIAAAVFSILQYFREDIVPYLNEIMIVCLTVLVVSVLTYKCAKAFRGQIMLRFAKLLQDQPNLSGYTLGNELQIMPPVSKKSGDYKLFRSLIAHRRFYCNMIVVNPIICLGLFSFIFYIGNNPAINFVGLVISAVITVIFIGLSLLAYYSGVSAIVAGVQWIKDHPCITYNVGMPLIIGIAVYLVTYVV